MIKDIEINPQFEKALHLIDETGKNIVALAPAGVATIVLLHLPLAIAAA